MSRPIAVSFTCLCVCVATALTVQGEGLCPGDCDQDGQVTVNEIVAAVRISLELAPVDTCPLADSNADARISVDELVQAVDAAIGCVADPEPMPTGALSLLATYAGVELNGTRSIAVSPDGGAVYVAGGQFSEGGIAVYERSTLSGVLSYARLVPSAPVARLVISPSGKHLYATTSGPRGLIGFERDAVGNLREIDIGPHELGQGRGLALSSDGDVLWVGIEETAVGVFERDAASGEVALAQRVEIGPFMAPDGIGVSDGDVYVVGPVYWPIGSGLNLIRSIGGDLVVNDSPIVGQRPPLNRLHDVAVTSGDPSHVYITPRQSSEQVTVFERDSVTGELEFVEQILDADLRASAMTMSPDGRFVIVVATLRDGGAVVLYARDERSGELEVADTLSAESGLFVGAVAVDTSPDGRFIYVATSNGAIVALNLVTADW